MGTFGCFEVTIGFFGNERVDYLTYETKGLWRCYEIKVSKSDFNSKAKKTFVGHYNYYVMTSELYEEVKDEIPKHIGVYIGDWCIKKPKKQELQVDEQVLKDSLIRSLYREYEKYIKTCDTSYISKIKKKITKLEKQLEDDKKKIYKYEDIIYDLGEKLNMDYREINKIMRETK